MELSKSGQSGYVSAAEGVRLYFETLGTGDEAVLVPNGFYFQEEFARFAQGRKLVFFDLRNRGRSDAISDARKLKSGVWNDVEDLEAVRRELALGKVALIGHSYVGLVVLLYAMKYPEHVSRVVALSPAAADGEKKYDAESSGSKDGVLEEVFAKLRELQKERGTRSEEEFCRRSWSVLAAIYVADRANAAKVQAWGRCELANERSFLKYWSDFVFPSLLRVRREAADFCKVSAPVLLVHGKRDRSAPYGGARDWAVSLPDARLLTLENVAHAPWIEAPEDVLGAIETFLGGSWPANSERVATLGREI
jgi:proline iminopeptidase